MPEVRDKGHYQVCPSHLPDPRSHCSGTGREQGRWQRWKLSPWGQSPSGCHPYSSVGHLRGRGTPRIPIFLIRNHSKAPLPTHRHPKSRSLGYHSRERKWLQRRRKQTVSAPRSKWGAWPRGGVPGGTWPGRRLDSGEPLQGSRKDNQHPLSVTARHSPGHLATLPHSSEDRWDHSPHIN